jgi:hypothetical protein
VGHTLLAWLKTEVLGKDLINNTDLQNIFHITSAEQVLSFIKKAHEDRSHMEHICANYSKYRVEFEQGFDE